MTNPVPSTGTTNAEQVILDALAAKGGVSDMWDEYVAEIAVKALQDAGLLNEPQRD